MEAKPKYFGSVRFFKHIILVVLALLILIPTTLSVAFGIQNHQYRLQLLDPDNPRQARKEDFEAGADDSGPDLMEAVPPVPAATPTPVPLAERPSYQELYPDLYAQPAERSSENPEKVVYLSFDDGPSQRTAEILDILDEYNIKATFFTIGKTDEQSQQWMRDILDRGHSLGIHSYTHKYHTIYQSVESYLEDFKLQYDLIYEATGTYPQIFRFPGGSINSYNPSLYQQIIAEMVRRGFVFFDWNVSAGDAENNTAANKVVNACTGNIANLRRAIILLHDSAPLKWTVKALPGIIEAYLEAGFTFDRLTPEVVPVVFNDR